MQALYPGCHRHSLLAFDERTEGTVTAVATIQGHLLDRKRAMSINRLAIEADEMTDAQTVDIAIVSRALIREVLAEL